LGAIVSRRKCRHPGHVSGHRIEEFSHLEMVGKLIAQHTSELDQTSLHDAPLLKLKAAARTSWTAKAALA
jgi:Mn-containing catalase